MPPQEWQAEPSKKTWFQILAEFFEPPNVPQLTEPQAPTSPNQVPPAYAPPPEILSATGASKESSVSAQ